MCKRRYDSVAVILKGNELFSSYWLVSAVLSWSLFVLLTRSTFETGINRLVLYLDFRVAIVNRAKTIVLFIFGVMERQGCMYKTYWLLYYFERKFKMKKKTLRICLKWSSRSSRWLFWVFFLLDTVECFYRTVDILEIPSKWLVVLYHFRRQLFLPQVFNRISWFRLPSLVLTSYIHPFPDILSFLECWHEIIGNKMGTKRKRERLSFGSIS